MISNQNSITDYLVPVLPRKDHRSDSGELDCGDELRPRDHRSDSGNYKL
jgi:hypothetical protein